MTDKQAPESRGTEVGEREAFEREISGPPYEKSILRFPDDDTSAWPSNYRDIAVDLAWCMWQARARHLQTTGRPSELRFFIDHDMIHDRLTGRHVHGDRGIDPGPADQTVAMLNDLDARAGCSLLATQRSTEPAVRGDAEALRDGFAAALICLSAYMVASEERPPKHWIEWIKQWRKRNPRDSLSSEVRIDRAIAALAQTPEGKDET